MPSLDKPLRNQLERTVKDARDVAETAIRSALEQLGVGEANPPPHLSENERDLRRRLRIHGRQLGDQLDEKKQTQQIDRLIEEGAYEHWHRMLFARFLAENNLLMYPDPAQPVPVSLAECEDLAADEGARNGWELAARFAAGMLPQIFRVESPMFDISLPPEHQQQLEKLISGLPVDVFTASDSLGWTYQFWQARRKDQVNESGVKIGARELPSVTQLFTEDYMVDFLLDNTLGAWWAGKWLNTSPTRERGTDSLADAAGYESEDDFRNAVSRPGCPWKYLRFIKGQDGRWTPAAGIFDGWPKTAKELKCLDPCMGSGHFVVAMFERLVALRMAEEDIDETEAIKAVIRDNLFGLEIDPRCTLIAAFNVALAAWRRIGYCTLPAMNLACSGLAPNVPESEWLALAGDNEKLLGGMERLYRLFDKAPVLGSLINPSADKGDLLMAAFHELQPLLEKAVGLTSPTRKRGVSSTDDPRLRVGLVDWDDTAHEMAVTARGLTKAAEILAGQFTLVATNVPYLGQKKFGELLKHFFEDAYEDGRADLATGFILRCLDLCEQNGTTALVTPQNWQFLGTYKKLRQRLLRDVQWGCVARLGARAFETITGEVVNVGMIVLTNRVPGVNAYFAGLDASKEETGSEKAHALSIKSVSVISQSGQLKNPDAKLSFVDSTDSSLLANYATAPRGVVSGDRDFWVRAFWELETLHAECRPLQSAVSTTIPFGARETVINWRTGGDGMLRAGIGNTSLRKCGVVVSQVGELSCTLYTGELYDNSSFAIVPNDPRHLLPIWAFCSSSAYNESVRQFNQKLSVDPSHLIQIPFDLAHWQKVAAEKYPHGLPKPFSSDPTQWLFNGHPAGADQPLHVAVARLVGYQWPRQTGSSFPDCDSLAPDGLESLADTDGIVCIPPVRGEAGAADRLLNLLAAAYNTSPTRKQG